MNDHPPPLQAVTFAGDLASIRTGDVLNVTTLQDGGLHVETSFDPPRLAGVLRRIAENVEEGQW